MAGEKVLVVVNDQSELQRLANLLAKQGLEATEASSGEEALRLLREGDYAVALVDLTLPGIGTVEMVERALHLKPEQSIIVMTPSGSADATTLLTLGAYTAVTKPVQPAELEIGLRNGLERYHLFRANFLLREETLQDDLTGVLNRRYLDRYLDEEIERSRRYKHPFSILFFDLDRLKQVNDQFGHLSGSKVLVEAVGVVKAKLRRADKIFRFGGDEFAVTLPETDQKGAIRVAHRLRRAMRVHRFHPVEGSEISLTASFGVATYPEDGLTGEALLRHADQAMYLVKTGTRDAVGIKE
ncbi:MAG: diguanylate cyclase, partial [Candidatus Methylomirabilales bacterium]